ncbi:hypothetical protein BDV96DRAFT_654425 [Lophiotrema nucula]|uniref:Uncharacterized protein n=1 Tax=Lophiotrema nucula TaxID=690887 RepID=A0A6A5YHA9_9PLEO|nr:hypothetical protein BDV96DRAFT_654425 [Lophiotrema nucula]
MLENEEDLQLVDSIEQGQNFRNWMSSSYSSILAVSHEGYEESPWKPHLGYLATYRYCRATRTEYTIPLVPIHWPKKDDKVYDEGLHVLLRFLIEKIISQLPQHSELLENVSWDDIDDDNELHLCHILKALLRKPARPHEHDTVYVSLGCLSGHESSKKEEPETNSFFRKLYYLIDDIRKQQHDYLPLNVILTAPWHTDLSQILEDDGQTFVHISPDRLT